MAGGKSPKATATVVWDRRFDFETRELTRTDLLSLGAQEAEGERLQGVSWEASNNWTVAREDIPLDDIRLGGLLATDKSFRLKDEG